MRLITAHQAIEILRERFAGRPRRIYVAGCSGAPMQLAQAFTNIGTPSDNQIEHFEGVWIPGIDTIDWGKVHETAKARSIFVGPAWRDSFTEGRFSFVPETYTQAYERFASCPFDIAFVQVSPPDSSGRVSLGISADFSLPAVTAATLSIAIINPDMPRPVDGVEIEASAFDLFIEATDSLPVFSSARLDERFSVIGKHIAGLIADYETPTLQFGLGNVQQAVLEALADTGQSGLKLHAGMVSSPLLELISRNQIINTAGSITCGVALGSAELYRVAAQDQRFAFRSVGDTHAAETLSSIPNLIAINSSIEVDLFGQANAEFIGTRQVSGGGGLTEFLAGAKASTGGLAIIALTATAAKGTVSRILSRLHVPAISVPRTLIDIIVTEYGVADIRGLDIDERAETLIGIAAPDHRESLASEWKAIRSQM